MHDFKTDLLLPLVRGVHLGYEFMPRPKWGLELEARYRWAVRGYINCPMCRVLSSEDQRVLTLNLNAKFYLLKKTPGSGLYLGAYVREDRLLSPPDPVSGYDILPDYRLPIRDAQPFSKYLRSSVGILAGYKFVAWKRLVLEASMGLDWDYRWLFGDRYGMDWTGIPSLKAGYRL
jgi:hypothetical protein